MNFTQWCKEETGHTWKELKEMGTTEDQRYRLYNDYEEYCNENHLVADFVFYE